MSTQTAKYQFLNGNGEDIIQVISPGGSILSKISLLDEQAAGQVVNANTATAGTTLTAANITGAYQVVLNMSGTLTGAANAQLPTVAALIAALPAPPTAGQTLPLRIVNSSAGAFAWTVTTNTGWTLSGTMTVGQNKFRDFAIIFTSASAATLQSLGGSDGAL